MGTVLVASTNAIFATAIGQMVSESGFTPAFPAEFEGPWLSLTRTQPRVVICDADAPVARLDRLIAEASSRRVPLVMAQTTDPHAIASRIAPVERVIWLRLPAVRASFRQLLRGLVPPTSARAIARAAADVLFFHPAEVARAASLA
jgi:hypothetical protein